MLPGGPAEHPVSAGGRATVDESATGGDVTQPDQGRLDPGPDGGRRVGQIEMELVDQLPRVTRVGKREEEDAVAFDCGRSRCLEAGHVASMRDACVGPRDEQRLDLDRRR